MTFLNSEFAFTCLFPSRSLCDQVVGRVGWSPSSSGTPSATETSLSLGSSLSSRTPCVLRPISRSSPWRRCAPPGRPCVMSISSSSSQTAFMPTTSPLRSVVLMLMTPWPPRRWGGSPRPACACRSRFRRRWARWPGCRRSPAVRDDDHVDDFVLVGEVRAPETPAAPWPAHGADVGFLEADGHAFAWCASRIWSLPLVMATPMRRPCFQADGDDAALHDVAEGLRGAVFFTTPCAVAKQEVLALRFEIADGQHVGDLLALLELQQVGDRSALALRGQLRHVVDLLPVHAALVGEEQQVVVVLATNRCSTKSPSFASAPLMPRPPRPCLR